MVPVIVSGQSGGTGGGISRCAPSLKQQGCMIGVYCGSRAYHFDTVTVLPVIDFIRALFAGNIF
jgi:hypothetical protein